MAERGKAGGYFAPLPHRAIGDTALSALELRVLAAIAYHDRLSGPRKRGSGCWAGNPKLAEECSCHLSSLSTAITGLATKGYIIREPHPINKRLRVFRVIYEHIDHLANSEVCERRSLGDSLANEKRSRCDTDQKPKPWRQREELITTVSRQQGQPTETVDELEVKYIPLSGEDITQKSRKNSVETASLCDAGLGNKNEFEEDSNIGGFLALVERRCRMNGINYQIDDQTRAKLDMILSLMESTDPAYNQAMRILDNWGGQ